MYKLYIWSWGFPAHVHRLPILILFYKDKVRQHSNNTPNNISTTSTTLTVLLTEEGIKPKEEEEDWLKIFRISVEVTSVGMYVVCLSPAGCGVFTGISRDAEVCSGSPPPQDTGYPHDGRADKYSYPHDGRADKNSYPHDGRADKDSYPHDRHNLYIMLSL